MTHSGSEISTIDDVVELFERQWTKDEHGLIERLLGELSSFPHDELLVELLRADIGRRYSVGMDVHLQHYFTRFPRLALSAEATAAICFEDYRARRHRGRSLQTSRWNQYPAVREQSWFIELQADVSHLESSLVFSVDPSSETALEARGHSTATGGDLPPDTEVMGDFELVSLLGQGAFSKVYLGRQISLGRRYVAIKVVNQPLREASHLARLQHTGIVPLYSCHRTRDKWILCMPYSGSATLADWLKGEAVPGSRSGRSLVETIRSAQDRITEAGSSIVQSRTLTKPGVDSESELRAFHQAATQPLHQLTAMPVAKFSIWIARRLASALAHAHQRGIVHGDLKPANILIRNDGEPALIDFNLSQVTDDAQRQWRGGTLAYMDPEHFRALISRTHAPVREQSDVFSLGVILYELVEGRLPFGSPASTAETDLIVAVQQRSKVPKFRERQTATEGFRSIIRKCLAADLSHRYSSAVALLEDLDREASHSPLEHAADPLVQSRLPKLIRRFPRLFSAGSIIFFSLLLIGILLNTLFIFQRRSERLAGLEALKVFEQLSDLQFAQFLQADSSGSPPPRAGTSSELLNVVQQFVTPAPGSKIELSDHERIQTEERLLALAFIEAYESLRMPTAQNSQRRPLLPLLEMLPPAAENTRTGQVIRAITAAAPKTSTAALRASLDLPRKTSKLTMADQTLVALGLLLQSEPRRALELLEATDPPESLRLIHWMTRGRAALELGEPRRAIAAFSMAMRDSVASQVFLNRGLAYFRLGSLQEADADFTACIQRSPEDHSGYLNRYAVRITMNRLQEAMQDLDRAIELRPDSARLRLVRSREHRKAGRLKASREDFESAMKSRPTTVEDWLSLALAKLPVNPQDSFNDLESAETLFGPRTSILQTMAHVLSEHLNRPQDAIVALDRLLEQEPSFQKALAGRAVLHARLGQVEQSLADVEFLKSLDTIPTPESLYQMACSLSICSTNQHELRSQAITLLAQAVRQNYGGDLMAQDEDLDAIRSLSDFEIIQKNYELISSPQQNSDRR